MTIGENHALRRIEVGQVFDLTLSGRQAEKSGQRPDLPRAGYFFFGGLGGSTVISRFGFSHEICSQPS